MKPRFTQMSVGALLIHTAASLRPALGRPVAVAFLKKLGMEWILRKKKETWKTVRLLRSCAVLLPAEYRALKA